MELYMEEKTPLELYIHIPFCAKKCLYCDFLSFTSVRGHREQYAEVLASEIEAMGKLYTGYEVVSIFFGGGTPSLLEINQTDRIMGAVKRSFSVSEDAEVTTEANPGTVDEKKLAAYRSLGINRLSLGLQSANDGELRELGRIHTFSQFLDSFKAARNAGFDNINVDLMSALPGQTKASYADTLKLVAELRPEHISAYSLIVEEGTPFYERYGAESFKNNIGDNIYPPLPDEDAEREMYHFTKAYLAQMGYERYEISNYAKKGRTCRHNEGYWTGTEYLGLGLGASSLAAGERFFCDSDLNRYLSLSPSDFADRKHHRDREKLTKQAQIEEFMFLGLRLTRGISSQQFERRFGRPVMEIYGCVLEKYLELGLMEKVKKSAVTGGEAQGDIFWRLTDLGTDVSNQVLCEFLL